MADITPAVISRAGALVSLVAAAGGGDAIVGNAGKTYLHVKNGGGSSITVTLPFNSTAVVDGQAATSKTVTVANGTEKVIGPFPPSLYNDVNGKVQVTYSGVTTVTVGAFTLSPEQY